jgi:O-antigen ligase
MVSSASGHNSGIRRFQPALPMASTVAVGLATVVATILAAQVSFAAFIVGGLAVLALVGWAARTWPRAALGTVALSAILDRYVVAGLLPPSLGIVTHLLSESLLAVVGLVLTIHAWREGRLIDALRHPATAFLGVFAVLAVASAVLNGVPAPQAAAGIAFTVDAVALFYLARMVGFTAIQARGAIAAFTILLVATAVIAVLQALLSPELFGLRALIGRYGEVYRLASIFGDPNAFAALISAAAPFAAVGAVHFQRRRDRVIALAALLVLFLALWLSFSRGGWLGTVAGFVFATALLDRRALVTGMLMLAVGFVVAAVMPRDILSSPPGQSRPDLVTSTFNRVETVGQGADLRVLFVLNAIPIARDHAVFGVGPGRYGGAAADLFGTPVYAQYGTDQLFQNPTQTTVDDFWLHLLVEAGALGLMAFVGVILSTVVPIFRAAGHAIGLRRVILIGIAAAATSLVVNSATTMLLEANSVAFVFWFLLGVGTIVASTPATGARGAAVS